MENSESEPRKGNKTVLAIVMLVGIGMVAVAVSLNVVYEKRFAKSTLSQSSFFPSFVSESTLDKYSQAAVSSDAFGCATIGSDILKKNGSAVDAAIAVLLCNGVVNPHSSGIGGGFLMVIYNREHRKAFFLDSRETAPARATKDMFNGSSTLSAEGGLAIAIPSEVPGFYAAHKQFGKLPWKDLFWPVINLCTQGIQVGWSLAKALQEERKIILNEPSLSEIFVNKATGDVFMEGDLLRRPDLVNTFTSIAANELGTPLSGDHELTYKLIQDIQNFGGIIDFNDMVSYRPRWMDPTNITFNGRTVYSSFLPGSGLIVSYILNILKGFQITKNVTKSKEESLLFYHRLVETFKFGYAKRVLLEDNINDPHIKKLIELLTSESAAEEARRKISDTQTFNDPKYYGAEDSDGFKNDGGTSHVSVLAPNGDAVAVTSTINTYFGSKRRSPSTGILLNNEMDDFSSPDIINSFDIPPYNKNLIVPGRRPLSSMSPTIVADQNGDVVLVVGGSGGSRITSGTASVAAMVLLMDADIKVAIDTPRVHHQLFPNHIFYESNFPPDFLVYFLNLGHQIAKNRDPISVVQGIHRDKYGTIYANSDFRTGGSTSGF